MRNGCYDLVRAAIRTSRSAMLLIEAAKRVTEEDLKEPPHQGKLVVLRKSRRKSRGRRKGEDRNS
jgi:hypothetical protein